MILLNAGPSGSHDSGLIIQRYQTSNNNGFGDVVRDTAKIIYELPIQTNDSNIIILPDNASIIDDYYKNWWIKIDSGFCNGQTRQIIQYNGLRKIAYLNEPFLNQGPSPKDFISMYNKNFVGIIYNELSNIFEFGSTCNNPNNNNVFFTDSIGISAKNILSTNITTNHIIINGTTDATSNTSGGTLTVSGGLSIEQTAYINTLYVHNVNITPNISDILQTISIQILNNKLDIPFLKLSDIYGFTMYIVVIVKFHNSNDNLYSNITITALNMKDSWELHNNIVGHDTGIEFTIKNGFHISEINILKDDTEYILYSTPDYGKDLHSIELKYRMITI